MSSQSGSNVPVDPQVYTARQIVDITGLSLATLARHRKDGIGIPFVRLGVKRVGYTHQALMAYLDQQTGK